MYLTSASICEIQWACSESKLLGMKVMYQIQSACSESKGVFIATQLLLLLVCVSFNIIEQLTQLNSVQPSQSCFCLWRHNLQTESTVVHAVELSSVELCRYKRALSCWEWKSVNVFSTRNHYSVHMLLTVYNSMPRQANEKLNQWHVFVYLYCPAYLSVLVFFCLQLWKKSYAVYISLYTKTSCVQQSC